MFIPLPVLVVVGAVVGLLLLWFALVLAGRNPLPFPDVGSRIFTTASPEAKETIVALLAKHGVTERFQVNTHGTLRSIMWDGTIVNWAAPETIGRLGSPAASIGLVAADPARAAEAAAKFLRQRGFSAEVLLDVEPELPIVFVVTDALAGSVLNFRKHIIHMPRPTTSGSAVLTESLADSRHTEG